MTYNPNIPISQDSPANQQAQIQTNFSQYGTIFSNNHSTFTAASPGDHETIILQSRNFTAPGVTNNYDVLYCGRTVLGSNQLFVQIPKFLPTEFDPTTAPNNPMVLTFDQVNTSGPIYQSFLPSEIPQAATRGPYLFFFGNTNDITVNITLSPAPSSLLLALAVPNTTSAGFPLHVSTNIINSSTFKINSDNASGVYLFSWMAIGLA